MVLKSGAQIKLYEDDKVGEDGGQLGGQQGPAHTEEAQRREGLLLLDLLDQHQIAPAFCVVHRCCFISVPGRKTFERNDLV